MWKRTKPTASGSSRELYDRMIETMKDVCSEQVSNITQLTNLVWLTVCILNGCSIALSELATYLPGQADAESRVTRIRRWLMNPRVEVWELYQPILREVLKGFQRQRVDLMVIVDGTMVFGDRLQVFRLSFVHGCRAIPLLWLVVPGQGLVKRERLEVMFQQVAGFLALYVRSVTCLADRGFRDQDWAELCREVGWHFGIRVTRNTQVTFECGRCCRIDQLGVRPGRIYCVNRVRLTAHGTGGVNLSVTWSLGDARHAPELVAVMSDLPASPQRLREYGWRMDIEQSFRDDKSGGFDIEHTRLHHPERLERLLLAVAIATIWCHELGEFVLQQGESLRRWIDPGAQRELSLFQLGLRFLKRALATFTELLHDFKARLHSINLAPVRASPSG